MKELLSGAARALRELVARKRRELFERCIGNEPEGELVAELVAGVEAPDDGLDPWERP